MMRFKAILLCCMMAAFHSISINGMSINDCDGLMCPQDTYCTVSSSSINGREQTVRTCTDMHGNVVAKKTTHSDVKPGSHRRVYQSSNVMMTGGAGGCVQQTRTVDGVTTSTYHCNNDNGNSYYVTNTNGEYKNCTSVPVTSDDGVTTYEERCVNMSPEEIQRAKEMEMEIQRQAGEVKQRLSNMAGEMQARNQQMHNQMKESMAHMQKNMQRTFDESMQSAKQTEQKMVQMGEDLRKQALQTVAQAQSQGEAAAQQAMQGFENMRQNFQNTFTGILS